MKRGITLIELLVIAAIISIVAAILIPALLAVRETDRQEASWSHVDYLVLVEGKLEKVEYLFDGQQYTVVHFQGGFTARLVGVNSIGYSRGDLIRISQKRLGAGTKYEKLENSYKVELLEAEAK